MAVTVYDFVPLSSAGSPDACLAESRLIYEAVMALDADPPCIGCSVRVIGSPVAAADQIIDAEFLRTAAGDAFPYLWVQVRYDPAVRSAADLEPIVQQFRLATVDHFEMDGRFVM